MENNSIFFLEPFIFIQISILYKEREIEVGTGDLKPNNVFVLARKDVQVDPELLH